jgi:hypothetical protein
MQRDRFGIQWFFGEEGAGGGDGGAGDGDKETRNLQNLLAKKNGDAMALAAQLLAENADLREDKRQLKKNQAPEGAVVLTGEDAAKWTAYTELGEPKAVKKQIEDAEKATTKLANLERSQAMREACEAAGIDFEDFSSRKGVDDVSYEVKTETKDGKAVKVPYITRQADGKTETKPLSEWAHEAFPTLAKAQQQETGLRAAKMGVGEGKVTNTYDAIRQEVKAKQEAQSVEGRDLSRAGIS